MRCQKTEAGLLPKSRTKRRLKPLNQIWQFFQRCWTSQRFAIHGYIVSRPRLRGSIVVSKELSTCEKRKRLTIPNANTEPRPKTIPYPQPTLRGAGGGAILVELQRLLAKWWNGQLSEIQLAIYGVMTQGMELLIYFQPRAGQKLAAQPDRRKKFYLYGGWLSHACWDQPIMQGYSDFSKSHILKSSHNSKLPSFQR
jgi:hypothetical protein